MHTFNDQSVVYFSFLICEYNRALTFPFSACPGFSGGMRGKQQQFGVWVLRKWIKGAFYCQRLSIPRLNEKNHPPSKRQRVAEINKNGLCVTRKVFLK